MVVKTKSLINGKSYVTIEILRNRLDHAMKSVSTPDLKVLHRNSGVLTDRQFAAVSTELVRRAV